MKRYYFGLKSGEILILGFVAMAAALVTFPYYVNESLWAGAGLAFFAFMLGHVCITASRFVILPGLISLIACISWVVAPFLSYLFPPSMELYQMAVPMRSYMSYMVPATFLLWLGVHLPLKMNNAQMVAESARLQLGPSERKLLDYLIIVGFL